MNARSLRILTVTLPSLMVAGGLGALGYLRNRFQHRQVFVPVRFPNGFWDPEPLGLVVEDVWFRAAEDLELHGWWIPHDQPQGTFLYCHGNTGSIAHQVGIFQNLRRLKINLFAFDYRGYGRSSGEPTEKGLYRDVRAAYDHLTGPLGQDPRSVILFGHSLGGAVAIDCAVDRPVAGLVIQSAFTHLRDAARAVFPTFPVHLAARNEFRSIDKVGRLAVPKLFIHGGSDGTVPVELGRQLYDAAAEPKELYIVPRGGHNDVYRHGGYRYLRRLARFRSRCLIA